MADGSSLAETRSLRDQVRIRDREARLHDPNIDQLSRFVVRLRRERPSGKIPWFDPLSGGVKSRVLLLLEAPGQKALQPTGSGFVSLDNDDRTADALHRAVMRAGLRREDVLAWNIVPWYVSDEEDKRIRAVKPSEVIEGARYLEELLALLPDLRVAVLLGVRAQQGWLEMSRRRLLRVPIVACPHPSPRSLATQGRWTEIVDALRIAGEALELTRAPVVE